MEGLTGSTMEGVHGGSIGSASMAAREGSTWSSHRGIEGLDGEHPWRDRGDQWGAARKGSTGSI
jgi:hypothetical protein